MKKHHHLDWKPKLNIEITEDQSKDLHRLIPYGIRTKVFSIIIDDLISLCKKAGTASIGAILSRKIGLGFSKLGDNDAKDNGDKHS